VNWKKKMISDFATPIPKKVNMLDEFRNPR
jgi:hypothetical protein